MKPNKLRKMLLFKGTLVAILAVGVQLVANANADPISDLRSLSVFKNADLSDLSKGTVSAAAGPMMRLARDMSVQSAYVVRAPVKTTVGLIQQWDPTRHSELRIYLQGDLPSRVSADSFRNLGSAPRNSAVRGLVDATQKLPGDTSKLQLSSGEAKQYPGGRGSGGDLPAPVVSFWSQVLAQRTGVFLSEGLSAEPAYGGVDLSPAAEVAQLINNSGEVRSHFSSLISSTPAGGGRGSLAPALSWQLLDANGQAALSLAASYAKPVADGYQIMDLGYYASGGYYAVVTLQQLWPVQVDGREATLVWRVDLVSSGTLADLRGTERLGSGAAMMRDIQKDIRAFVRDAGNAR
jgi:hypothetical protein